MEAHDSELRALVLTADGSKLATASEKGTVLRVWDVASSACLYEFRRGVERATITCLSWSWDHSWLACTSDKGTAHIFQVDGDAANSEEKKSAESTSYTQMFLSSVRKSVEGDAKKSVCQIRGVPHPQACTFVSSATNLVAVAGWDADGNGVLLLSEFKPGQEPTRVGYHVLCKSAIQTEESDETRRRRRLRGWTPEVPQTPEGGRLYVGERLEILERGMEQITFEENGDDEFVSVSTVQPKTEKDEENKSDEQVEGTDVAPNSPSTGSSNFVDSGTVSDSVRTEPLDDEPETSELASS
jgi:WD40 repeat protein